MSESCGFCAKLPPLCLCDWVKPVHTRIRVLILRHPREQDQELGTAVLLSKCLTSSVLKTGLSWRNLGHALGAAPPESKCDPSRWAVFYSGSKAALAMAKRSRKELVWLDRKGEPLEAGTPTHIDGIVLLDGSWQQAKALWWRNAWLTKLKRALLVPKQPSLYGRARRQARPEHLATIEAAALALDELAQGQAVRASLENTFKELLRRFYDR